MLLRKTIEYIYILETWLNIKYYQNYPRVGMVGVKGQKGGQPYRAKFHEYVKNTKWFVDEGSIDQ